MPVHADDRLNGGALAPAGMVHQYAMNNMASRSYSRPGSGKVGLSQLDQLVLVLAGDGFAARTRQVCLHVGAFPSALAAAFLCLLCDRTCPSDPASTISATDR